jgi:cytochrome c peroxidase
MRGVGLVIALAISVGGVGCGGGSESTFDDAVFSATEWAQIEQLSPLPELPPDTGNDVADDPAAAALGQRLYWERRTHVNPIQIGRTTVDPSVSPPLTPNPSALGEAGDTRVISCASCHEPGHWHSDSHSMPRNLSLAVRYTFRNDPSLVNAAFYESFGWSGVADALWSQITGNPEAVVGATRGTYAHVVYDHYKADYEAIFGALPAALDPAAPDAARFPADARPRLSPNEMLNPRTQAWVDAWEGMTADDQRAVNRILANSSKALAAYVRRLVSRNAPFDRYVGGDFGAIPLAAKRGLKLFIGKAGCVSCHSGPFFSDNRFHATGVAQVGENVPAMDSGRFAVMQAYAAGLPTFSSAGEFSDDIPAGMAKLAQLGLVSPSATDAHRGQFRTKSLRQIAETAPYMHHGGLADLAAVIELYDRGGDDVPGVIKDPLMVELNLSAAEKADLVAFLQTLTGDPIPAALLADTSAP